MKDRVYKDIGAVKPEEMWKQIDWRATKEQVKNLRHRIYRATQEEKWNQVRSLMKLMLRSRANLLVSARRVTQENAGKNTPGVDGRTATTALERGKLVKEMQLYQAWKVKPTKRIYIPKANGQKRPLGIPCLIDRVMQAIVKNALEPSWEARFESRSYGFRPGRSTQDAIQHCWSCFKSDRPNQWVLDADIKGAFDNVCHTNLLKQIGEIPGRALIKKWLKAGYLEQDSWNATEQGTPQGGVISPLLMNIALYGMQTLLSQFKRIRYYTVRSGKYIGKRYPKEQPRYRLAVYADDFVISTETKEEAEAAIPILSEWLKERGLQLHPDKTRVVNIAQGFNFLGTTVRRYNGICIVKPQKEKVLLFLKRIRTWIKDHPEIKQESLIQHLNPVIRGWGEYYRSCSSKNIFGYVDHEIWKAIWGWCLRKHPNKGKRWVANKYFHTMNNRKWIFAKATNDRQGKKHWVSLKKLSAIKIKRHVMVKGNASPDDPNLKTYWKNRQEKRAKENWEQGSRFDRVASKQNWCCPICAEGIFNDERIHLHHKIPIKEGGNEGIKNLVWLHKICHQQIHSNKEKLEKLKA